MFPATITNYHLDQLAGLVGHIIGEFPPLQKALGSPMMPRRFWLEIDIPSGPPPEYVRSGYIEY